MQLTHVNVGYEDIMVETLQIAKMASRVHAL